MHRSLRLLCLLMLLALTALSSMIVPTQSALAAPDDPDIVGGDPVPLPNPYVWQVKLDIFTADGSVVSCGGSVISEQWILTAAHCLIGDFVAQNVVVTVGQANLSQADTTDRFLVADAIIHEEYMNVGTGNDIALLRLERPIPNAEAYIVPLMTPAREAAVGQAGTMATVAGWGNTIPKNGQSAPDMLHYVNLPITTQEACRGVWGDLLLDSMVCAGMLGQEKDSCQGDSGGAMIVPDGVGSYVQNGIVSFGHISSCSSPNHYSVYTRVSSFIGWIEANTGLDFSTRRAPDLVVEGMVITESGDLGVVVTNQGSARVALDQGFWVDLYISPRRAPRAVNEVWNVVGDSGAVWGVDQINFVLLPGESIVLILGDSVYWPTHSKLPLIQIGNQIILDISTDTRFYVQVDSANADTNYGGIMETHELTGGSYNNIAGPFTLAQDQVMVSGSAAVYRLYLPLVTGDNSAQTAQAPATTQTNTTADSTPATHLPARAQ